MGNVNSTQRQANIRTIKLVYNAHIVAVSFSSSSPGLGDRSLPQQLSWLPWTARETRVLTVTPTSTTSFPGRQDCPTFPAMTTSWSSAGTFLIRTRTITFYKRYMREMQLQYLLFLLLTKFIYTNFTHTQCKKYIICYSNNVYKCSVIWKISKRILVLLWGVIIIHCT